MSFIFVQSAASSNQSIRIYFWKKHFNLGVHYRWLGSIELVLKTVFNILCMMKP